MRDDEGGTSAVHLIHAFPVSDSRAASPSSISAVQDNLNGLLSRDVIRLVDRRTFLSKGSHLSGRIIRCLMNVGTSAENFKARFLVQGHRDSEKAVLLHDSATLRQSSIRLILSVASSFRLSVWALYINQTYTISSPTTRQIFIKPDHAFGIDPNIVFQIRHPLHGLAHAEDAWWESLRTFKVDSLQLMRCVRNTFLYFLSRITPPSPIGAYVDDIIFAGGKSLREISHRIASRFPSKPMT